MLRAADTIWKTDTGRQRRDNEDNAFVRAPVFVVADGMGGAQAGEVASALAVQEFQEALPDHGSPVQRLTRRIREANRRIYELSQAEHEHRGMGTTLTAVYVDEDDLAVAHVGDSRAYIFRDGMLTRLTQDHSLVEELVRQGKLTEAQAAEHPQRSIITRALGIEVDVEVDTWTYPARAGDVVLLCSDGLTSMIDEDQVADTLATATSLDQAGERLIAAANDAGGRDNITVVLFRLVQVSDATPGDEPTVVGMQPVTRTSSGDDGGTRSRGASQPDPGGVITASSPSVRQRRAGPRLARTQGRPGPGGEPGSRRPRSERFIKTVAALIAVVVVVFIVGGGAYLASRQYFFVATNADGIITIYRGFPYDLPLGVHMYEQFYVSGVPASAVPADRRSELLNHQLRSQASSVSLVQAAEQGRLSR
ncbi:MAG: Stp1/IreP family PP2C-type Ser/Thr phosphatase [Solirubrobacteraceae bacterium]